MQTGSSGTLIGWKSGQTTYFPLWDRMEGAWLWTQKTFVPITSKNSASVLEKKEFKIRGGGGSGEIHMK